MLASTVALGDVIINEVDADTPGYDSEEFIELYDGGIGFTPLDGMVVVLFNGSDDLSYNDAFDLDGFTTDENGYFVIGSVPESDLFVDPGSSGWLQNGADAVALYMGDGSEWGNDTPFMPVGLIDAIVYDTNDSDDTVLMAYFLNPGEPQVNEDGNDDKDLHSNQRCPNGSGGAFNTFTYDQFLPTPGAENICALPTEVEVPARISLEQNYPNPFNPATTIDFALVEPGNVSLMVFDMSGSAVASLVNGEMVAGYHSVVLDATGMASGVYFYTLQTAGQQITHKMVLMK